MQKRFFGLPLVLVVAGITVSAHAAIRGRYVEVRNADVWTGPCFANSQVDLQGNEAMMGWKVTGGTWNGVNLKGLSVIAVLKAKATLGDHYHDPYPAESVIIVDQQANEAQRAALENFARAQAGRLLDHVARVETAPITFKTVAHDAVSLQAGKLAMIRTRALCSGDVICGNEFTYYPPLVKDANAMPAYTEEEAYNGRGLGVVWNRIDRRSAFVGTFGR
jgi:hypothetical protein